MSQLLSAPTPESENQLPPPPLTVDDQPSPELDSVLARKRSRRLFKSSSIRRKRKDSTASQNTVDDGPQPRRGFGRRPPGTPLAEHVRDGDSLEHHNEHPTVDLTDPVCVQIDPESSKKQLVDTYRWAVLFENQRGVTLLGMSRYGSRSLFPNDPSAYTIPISSLAHLSPEDARKAMLTPCTPRDFQLPDAKWRWVSKYWMVDMRGDGQVDAAGFEYNWGFRTKGWRPHPGTLSAGGWVRRRRWVRLMMRPADRTLEAREFNSDSPLGGLTPSASRTTLSVPTERRFSVTTRTTMTTSEVANQSYTDLSIGAQSALGNTWRGDPQGDWERCHRLLKHFGRDGRKLELWSDWLGVSRDSEDGGREDYMTVKGDGTIKDKGRVLPARQDSAPSPMDIQDPLCLSSEDFFTPQLATSPDRDYIIPVLKEHGSKITAMFIFPDSRAQFLNMLDRAGIGRHVLDASSPPSSPTAPAFWSRRSRITEVSVADDQTPEDMADGTEKKLAVGGKIEAANRR